MSYENTKYFERSKEYTKTFKDYKLHHLSFPSTLNPNTLSVRKDFVIFFI